MWNRLRALRDGWLPARRPRERRIPDELWHATTRRFAFIAALPAGLLTRLRALSGQFLAQKEFHGAQGLEVTDAMAVAIAAQACMPLLRLPGGLAWYGDFVGIVVYPSEVLARREVTDETGVVHQYGEVLAGEALEGGPVVLSWEDVAGAGETAEQGYNVVIHEFIHKIDMRHGAPTGCPPLPAGFLGTGTAREAREHWLRVLEPAYAEFRDKVIIAERFSGTPVWLDPYGAESIDEFFAVACEAYFVNRERFAREFPTLPPLFDAFFQPEAA